jgi:hypothetical protein
MGCNAAEGDTGTLNCHEREQHAGKRIYIHACMCACMRHAARLDAFFSLQRRGAGGLGPGVGVIRPSYGRVLGALNAMHSRRDK